MSAITGSNSTINTTTEVSLVDMYLPYEQKAEGTALLMIAITGTVLNLYIIIIILARKRLRSFINGFTVHSCILDTFKSLLCIPFALTVLDIIQPVGCKFLGLTYIVMLTVSMFNLLAMVMTEAYVFHEKNINDCKDHASSACMCLLFGLITIYVGSVILHLGPTLIGGEFKFNRDVGNCMFAYGKVQNYIVQAIWISIVTLTLITIIQYIIKFYQQLNANQRFRITNLARNAAAYTRGLTPNEDIYSTVCSLKKKVRIFICITVVYCLCWYPLYILTITDPKYVRRRYIYRILTVLAWSHSALVPVVHVVLDESYSLLRLICQPQHRSRAGSSQSRQNIMSMSRDSSAGNSLHLPLSTAASHNHTPLYQTLLHNQRQQPQTSTRSLTDDTRLPTPCDRLIREDAVSGALPADMMGLLDDLSLAECAV